MSMAAIVDGVLGLCSWKSYGSVLRSAPSLQIQNYATTTKSVISCFPKTKFSGPKFPTLSSSHACGRSICSSSVLPNPETGDLKSIMERTRKYAYLFSREKHQIFTLRIVLRDEDGLVRRKLQNLITVVELWDESCVVSKEYYMGDIRGLLSSGSDCLLENADCWICGQSHVCLTYAQLSDDLHLLMKPFEFFPRKNTKDKIDGVEVILQIFSEGVIFKEDIHTREDLEQILRQLKTCDNLFVLPPNNRKVQLDKKKVDEIESYSHNSVGKYI